MQLAYDEVIKKYTITREKRASAFNMSVAHYHDHYEIYFLTQGSVRYFVEDRIFDLNEGDVILIPPHVIHKTATLKNAGSERIVVAFTNEFIMRSANDKIFNCFSSFYFSSAPIKELILKAESECLKKDIYSEDLIASYIREMLVLLTRQTSRSSIDTKSVKNTLIQNAVHYITDNYGLELSLTELSRKFALSESHFSREFKAFTGFGVNEYITQVRIKNAEILLRTTKLTVTEVAARCGFNSSSYFAAVFKKLRGVSPKKAGSAITMTEAKHKMSRR